MPRTNGAANQRVRARGRVIQQPPVRRPEGMARGRAPRPPTPTLESAAPGNGETNTLAGSPGRDASNAIHRRSGDNRGFLTDRSALSSSSCWSPVSVSMSAIEFRRANRSMMSRRSSTHSRGRPPQSSPSFRQVPSGKQTMKIGRNARSPPGILVPYASRLPLGEIAGYPFAPAGPSARTLSEPVWRSLRNTSPCPSRNEK